MTRRRSARALASIACVFSLVHCAWIMDFESSYSVEPDAGAGTRPLDGGRISGGPLDDAGSEFDSGTPTGFGKPVVLARGERPPFGGIAADQASVYWTLGVLDGGIRSVDRTGGTASLLRASDYGGSYQEIFAIPADTLYWRVAETSCAANVACGRSGPGSWGSCGMRSRRLRTDGRRFYLLLEEANSGRLPIEVITKGCEGMASVTRLTTTESSTPPYVNIAPDRSGNRVFAVANNSVSCLPVTGAAPVPVVQANVLDLAASDTHLYWLTPSELHRCALGSDLSCAACTDDEVLTRTEVGSRPALVLHRNTLYWLAPDGVRSLGASAAAGSTPATLASGQPDPTVLAVDDAGVYWANAGDGSIVLLPTR